MVSFSWPHGHAAVAAMPCGARTSKKLKYMGVNILYPAR
jgi:hypothetical protein